MTIEKLPPSPILPPKIDGDGSTFIKSLKSVEQKVASTINRILDEGVGGGSEILTGTGIPSASVGSNDDLYIDSSTCDVYKKGSGVWSNTGLNIKGSIGQTGQTGSTGSKGDKGDRGDSGIAQMDNGTTSLTTGSSSESGVYYSGSSWISFSTSFTSTPHVSCGISTDGGGNHGGVVVMRWGVTSSGFYIAVGGVDSGSTVPIWWEAIAAAADEGGSSSLTVPTGDLGLAFYNTSGVGVAALRDTGLFTLKTGGGIQLNSSTGAQIPLAFYINNNVVRFMEKDSPYRGATLTLTECLSVDSNADACKLLHTNLLGSGLSMVDGKLSVLNGGGTAVTTYVNVKDYGAKGDGSTDDTTAMQAAHDTYHTVFYPKGIYLCRGITIKYGGIVGEGKGTTMIKSHTSCSDHLIKMTGAQTSSVMGPTFRDISLYGGASGKYLMYFEPPDATNSDTSDPWYRAMSDGTLHPNQILGLTFSNVNFMLLSSHQSTGGIYMNRCTYFTVDGCLFYGAWDNSTCGIQFANDTAPDEGDSTIVNSVFMNGLGASSGAGYSVLQRSSGGMRLLNNKFTGGNIAYLLKMDYFDPSVIRWAMDLSNPCGTAIFLCQGNSFEAQYTASIYFGRTAKDGQYKGNLTVVNISNNEFAGTTINGSALTSYGIAFESSCSPVNAYTGFRSGYAYDHVTISGNGFNYYQSDLTLQNFNIGTVYGNTFYGTVSCDGTYLHNVRVFGNVGGGTYGGDATYS